MSTKQLFAWVLISVMLAFAGDNLIMRGELQGKWYFSAVGRILYAFALSMLMAIVAGEMILR